MYCACVSSTLIYGSETWSLSSVKEKKINTFRLQCLRSILKIKRQQKITNEKMLKRTGLTIMYFTLSQRRLCWLGHILRMGDKRIPKSMLYSKLVDGTRKHGWPTLRYKDVCKRDLKNLNVGTDKWEELANDRDKWLSSVYKSLKESVQKSVRHLYKRRIHSIVSIIYIFCSITMFVLI